MCKNFYFIYTALIFLLLNTGCQRDNDFSKNKIYLAESMRKGSVNTLLFENKKIKIIDLEETDSTLLSPAIKLFDFEDGHIWGYERGKIYNFENNGICRKIISNNGEGPHEYLGILDVVRKSNGNLVVLDFRKGQLYEYDENGNYINHTKEELGGILIANNELTGVTMPKNSQTGIEVLFFDNKLNKIDSILISEGTETTKGFINIPSISNLNNNMGILISDTLFKVDSEHNKTPFLIFETGDLKMPDDIKSDFKLMDKRSSYIDNLNPLVWGDLVFLEYYYKNNVYFDIWDLNDNKIIYRNVVSGTENRYGFPLKTNNGKVYNVWPKFVKENLLVGGIFSEFQDFDSQDNTSNPKVFIMEY